MKRIALVCLIVLVSAVAACRPSDDTLLEVVLFDFEKPVGDWSGNPWKGGKCLFELTTDARFGKGALHGWYEGVPRKNGGTIICPTLAPDAEWRKHEWGAISLWVKGDGSASRLNLILADDAKEHSTFSKVIPLDSKEWRRFSFSLRSFWNRGKRELKASRLRRFYFHGTPPQSFVVDRIALEAPHRQVPIEATGGAPNLPFDEPALLEYAPGKFGVRLIPPLRPREKAADVRVAVQAAGGGREENEFKMQLGPGADERLVTFQMEVTKDAEATLDVKAQGDSGKEYSARFRFYVFRREPPADKPYLSICPLPKEMKPREGVLALRRATAIAADLSAPGMKYCVDLLREQVKKWYGLEMKQAAEGNVVLKVEPLDLPAEGYILSVTPDRITVKARDAHGVYNGIQTLLQAVADSTDSPGSPQVKCVEIKDWPSLRFRSAMIALPTDKWGHPNDPEVDVGDFLDFLYNTMARHKLNVLVLNTRQGYRYQSAPLVGAEHAWGRGELERIRDFCKRHFIEVIPNVNSMGHASWLLYRYKHLRWHDDMQTFCTCKPETYEMLTGVYDELIEIFQPRIFHIGMDEVRWKGNPKNPNPPRCLCDDIPKWEQFGRWVKRLHDHLASKGVRTMMWGDMLLVEHNGGPPFFTARALKAIPRDVIIANWSTGSAAISNFFFNRKAGFHDVVQSNSSGVEVEQSPYVMGNMFGMWSKVPWISQRDKPGSQRFCYLALVQGGEFSWNLDRAGAGVSKRYWADYLRAREDSVLRTLAILPEPRAGTGMEPVALDPIANARVPGVPGGEVTVARIKFRLLSEGRCVRVPPGGATSLPVGCKAASLYFLHAEELPDDPAKMQAFRDRWKKPENVWGVPVARYEIVYDDGATETMQVRHSWNILPERMERTLPYAYRVLGPYRLRGDAPESSHAICAAQWVNPRPGERIKMLRFICEEKEPAVCVFAVTARAVAER